MKTLSISIFSLIILCLTLSWKKAPESSIPKPNPEVEEFLTSYNLNYQKFLIASNNAEWALNTHIVDGDNSNSEAAKIANLAMAKFTGSNDNVERAREFLKLRATLTPLEIKQLEYILYLAGANPESASAVIEKKIEIETQQTEKLFGYHYQLNGQEISTNQIDEMLRTQTDIKEREKVWEASKEVGVGLKEGVISLRELRNESVQALGYKDYFSYQVSDYGMGADEMIQMCNGMISDIWPLYRELHTWARYTLAKKYNQPVPDYLPAHWLPNRWGQDWTALVDVKGLNIDEFLKEKGPEYIVRQGEAFYMSLGFSKLPDSFYEKSSLYPVAENAGYKKNNHASAWHMDFDKDVRSLMSVEPNTEWWGTVLHELGHIYYYQTYSNPNVPLILRNGANRGYHEAMGSLIGLASLQKSFLVERGMVDKNVQVDEVQLLLREALDYIVHIPWGAGVMSNFEYELYSNKLEGDQLNHKWWELVKKYQGIVPPSDRSEAYCDAATKTHIVNDPAQYYDYSISNVLLFMFHKHIAEQILKQNPHNTNYWGSKETGEFLRSLMVTGATEDWRMHLRKHLGSEMSAKAMIDYFSPLLSYLKNENKGRKYTLPEKL